MEAGGHVCETLCKSRHDTLIARLEGMDGALKLRTEELNRRLEMLNELRVEVVKDRNEFILKRVYDVEHRILAASIEEVRKAVNDIGTRITIVETRNVTWTAAVGVFFALIQIGLHYWTR